MGDSLRHVDVMMNEMRNLPRGINWQQVRWLTGYSDGVCATLCGKTESATSIVDIGDIILKTIKSYILLRPTWNERCNSPNIHCLDSVTIIDGGGRRAKIDSPRSRFADRPSEWIMHNLSNIFILNPSYSSSLQFNVSPLPPSPYCGLYKQAVNTAFANPKSGINFTGPQLDSRFGSPAFEICVIKGMKWE